jgi:hypothetical protein
MKKIALFILSSGLLLTCTKENATPGTDAQLKGKWVTNLTTDVIFDNATGTELTRVSYLHGLEISLTFNGTGSVTSYNAESNTTLTHGYNVHTANKHTYITTQLVGFAPAEYEILALSGPDLQIKAIVITDSPYSINGKNYRVHYERTQFFTKQ